MNHNYIHIHVHFGQPAVILELLSSSTSSTFILAFLFRSTSGLFRHRLHYSCHGTDPPRPRGLGSPHASVPRWAPLPKWGLKGEFCSLPRRWLAYYTAVHRRIARLSCLITLIHAAFFSMLCIHYASQPAHILCELSPVYTTLSFIKQSWRRLGSTCIYLDGGYNPVYNTW